MELSPIIYKSRLFGVNSPEQAAVIMLKGFELGMSLTASFEFVQVVLGKPGLSPRGAMALLVNHPEITKIDVKRLTKDDGSFYGYECTMIRKNGFQFTSQFTMDDAKRAGVVKVDSGWATYPENMCRWRCIGFVADMVAPDIICGMSAMMKMPEQFGAAIDDSGNIIDAVAQPAYTTPAVVDVPPQQLKISLDDLLNMFGAEAILAANEGKIPGTDEEIAAVAAKMAGAK